MWLLTVDFEAFDPEAIDDWLEAMRQWARLSAEGDWHFSIFLAIEDVVRLRKAQRGSYDAFTRLAKELHETGSTFYPHNHGVFDIDTGLLASVRPERIPGYGKRASFVYDVVHRHGEDLSDWLGRVVSEYERFLCDAGIPRPRQLTFRAGGWDHGDTAESSRAYVRALEGNSFRFDSSASSGTFGTRSWSVGAPFGSNVFSLSSSLLEIAPCWSLNCDAKLASRETAGPLARLLCQPRVWLSRTAPGAFVTVLHFDHLFRAAAAPPRPAPCPVLRSGVVERVNRFFRLISILRRSLQLETASFEDLKLRW